MPIEVAREVTFKLDSKDCRMRHLQFWTLENCWV
ncbi:unnamed protein product [uncultured bacterium]|nr:unnamed protein product [uncultured bacterium]